MGKIQRTKEMEVYPLYSWVEATLGYEIRSVYCPSSKHRWATSSTPEGYSDFSDVQTVVLFVVPGYREFSFMDMRREDMAVGDSS